MITFTFTENLKHLKFRCFRFSVTEHWATVLYSSHAHESEKWPWEFAESSDFPPAFLSFDSNAPVYSIIGKNQSRHGQCTVCVSMGLVVDVGAQTIDVGPVRIFPFTFLIIILLNSIEWSLVKFSGGPKCLLWSRNVFISIETGLNGSYSENHTHCRRKLNIHDNTQSKTKVLRKYL